MNDWVWVGDVSKHTLNLLPDSEPPQHEEAEHCWSEWAGAEETCHPSGGLWSDCRGTELNQTQLLLEPSSSMVNIDGDSGDFSIHVTVLDSDGQKIKLEPLFDEKTKTK